MRRRARLNGAEPDGYLLLRKRPGITSFEALNFIKRSLDTGRVGHSGTLDKFAEGLLVVLVGRSTRLVPWFTGCDKIYEGTISFGAETDTLDPEGTIVAEAEPPTEKVLRAALTRFQGNIMQAPPLYSSVHIDGKRAHEIARSGETVDMKERSVTIHSIELLSYDGSYARVRVHCSKGTYIRSLARDIGIASGSRAYVTALKRTKVAGFDLSDAVDPMESADPEKAVREALRPIGEAAFAAIGLQCRRIAAAKALHVAQGKPLDSSWFAADAQTPAIALFSEEGRFLAVAVSAETHFNYGFVAVRPEDL